MKKILVLFILVFTIFNITGCSSEEEYDEDEITNNYITVTANDDGEIIIEKEDITSTATFVNYEVDGVIIQFIVVRGTDGVVRIAFNTCQACNPSPNAYFVQVGEYLQCQNCGNKFHIDKIGVEQGGCNPTPVEEMEEDNEKFVIDKDYVDSFKEKFADWNGPVA